MKKLKDTWVVTLYWSQTDHENVLVTAKTREKAEKKVRDVIKGGWVMVMGAQQIQNKI